MFPLDIFHWTKKYSSNFVPQNSVIHVSSWQKIRLLNSKREQNVRYFFKHRNVTRVPSHDKQKLQTRIRNLPKVEKLVFLVVKPPKIWSDRQKSTQRLIVAHSAWQAKETAVLCLLLTIRLRGKRDWRRYRNKCGQNRTHRKISPWKTEETFLCGSKKRSCLQETIYPIYRHYSEYLSWHKISCSFYWRFCAAEVTKLPARLHPRSKNDLAKIRFLHFTVHTHHWSRPSTTLVNTLKSYLIMTFNHRLFKHSGHCRVLSAKIYSCDFF